MVDISRKAESGASFPCLKDTYKAQKLGTKTEVRGSFWSPGERKGALFMNLRGLLDAERPFKI